MICAWRDRGDLPQWRAFMGSGLNACVQNRCTKLQSLVIFGDLLCSCRLRLLDAGLLA